jgi:integrase
MSKRAAKRTKGQGGVFLDPPSPYWQLSYWNGWRQVRESARITDYAEAVKTLQRKLGEIAVGKSAGAERIRVAALLELLIEDYRRHDRADLQEAEQRVNRLLKPIFGQLRASAFTTKALNHYIELRQNQGRQNATINRELALLRRAFRLGHQHDPQLVFRLPVIKALPEDNIREGFLEADKYRLIVDALTDEIKPVFVVAYHLGMRTGELLAIKRSWVDLGEGLMYVNGRVTKNRNPKTAPIYGDMRPWLEMLFEPRSSGVSEVHLAVLAERQAGERFQSRLGASLREGGGSGTAVPRSASHRSAQYDPRRRSRKDRDADFRSQNREHAVAPQHHRRSRYQRCREAHRTVSGGAERATTCGITYGVLSYQCHLTGARGGT